MTIVKLLGYKRYFNAQELLFNSMGVDLIKGSVKYPCLLWFPSLLYAMFVFWLCWENRQDINTFSELMTAGFDNFIFFLKSLYFVVYVKKFLKLIHTMWIMCKTDDLAEKNMIQDLNAKAYYLSNALVTIGLGAIFGGCLLPYIVMAVMYLQTGEFYFTPSYTSFFSNNIEPWKQALLFTGIAIAVTIGAISNLAIDTLYIWLVFNLMAQFRILNMKIKRTTTHLTDTEINLGITECIRFHQQIIEFSENLNLSYCLMNFVQFAMDFLPFSMLGFQLTMGSTNQMFILMYIACKLFQIALYCALGQQIQDESISVADNIYGTYDWEKLSKKSKQNLLFVMSRAQKVCYSSGIFFVVDLSLFEWVLRTTSSYVTILWTLAANAKE